MKTRNKLLGFIAIAIIALALAGCGGNDTAPETFTVTFIANGGTPEPQAKTVEKGSKVDEPSIKSSTSYLKSSSTCSKGSSSCLKGSSTYSKGSLSYLER